MQSGYTDSQVDKFLEQIEQLQAENERLRNKEIANNNLIPLLEKQIKRAETENEKLRKERK